ncbi:hypothetical protein TSAR_002780 [Trichomalopsis sarcophagae]|uniref:G-protein coupled receptors family 2 profile 2 domain-containing protein n=1 Tax=Trichomalopsis sarcophagae TaxID=543379 RepID=A0A232FJU6_9HYME|nr:hypothetical protein TSAR_002780 [Trichomalopsis sarcophagae]
MTVRHDISVVALAIVVQVLLLLVGPGQAYLRANETECPTEALVDLTASFEKNPDRNGSSIVVDGVFYPADAIRWQGNKALGCPCRTRGCLPLCCSHDSCMGPVNRSTEAEFFPVHSPESMQVDPDFQVSQYWQFAWNPCHGGDRYILTPENPDPDFKDDKFQLLSNGSMYQPTIKHLRNYTDFCVDYMNNTYRMVVCFDEGDTPAPSIENIHSIFPTGMLISVPFLIATFVVYMLIPELRNIHGQTLCAYVFSLIVAYIALSTLQIIKQDTISDLSCYVYAYIVHFSFLASFFWLNVMCFDIWWTFG